MQRERRRLEAQRRLYLKKSVEPRLGQLDAALANGRCTRGYSKRLALDLDADGPRAAKSLETAPQPVRELDVGAPRREDAHVVECVVAHRDSRIARLVDRESFEEDAFPRDGNDRIERSRDDLLWRDVKLGDDAVAKG